MSKADPFAQRKVPRSDGGARKTTKAATDTDMGVTPDLSRKANFRGHFTTATPERRITTGHVTSDVGRTSSGKTTRGASMIKANEDDCAEEVETYWGLSDKDTEVVIEELRKAYKSGRLLQTKELFVFGTEESTEECIYSDDLAEFFADHIGKKQIHYKEIFIRAKDPGLEAGVDGIESIKELNTIILDLESDIENERKAMIGLLIDSASTIFGWCNEVIRRNVMKVPKMKQHQGVPAHFWFWRNLKMESLALTFKNLNIPVWQTWKFKKTDDGYVDIPVWHPDYSGHLSSTIVYSYQERTEDGPEFISVFQKCRNRNKLVGKPFPGLTANMINALSIGLEDHMSPAVSMDSKKRASLFVKYND